MIPAQSSIAVKTLDRKHAEWLLMHDMWDAVDLLYDGGVRLKNNGQEFLLKRPKELYDVYQERQRRLTYQNLLGNCVGWYIAKLFSREPQVEGKTDDSRFSDFLQDCDRGGTTFIEFSKTLVEMISLYRRAFVLIDKPAPGDNPVITRADEKQQGLDRPYLVTYDPRQIFNWRTDSYGNLQWIIIKTIDQVQDGPLDPVKQVADWYLFDRETFAHYRYENPNDPVSDNLWFDNSDLSDSKDAMAKLVDAGPHALTSQKRVPVRVWQLPKSLWFTNRAYLHLLEHFDQKNGYAWKLFMCAHPQLVIQTETEIKGQTLSEVGFLQLKPEDKIFWLEPDGGSLTESRSYTDNLRQEIYRDFHLQAQGKDSSATADGASGYSKEMEMAPAVDMLNAIGDVIRAEQQLVLLDYRVAAAMPIDSDDLKPSVNGFRFETKPLLQDISVAEALIETGVTQKSKTLEIIVDTNIALSAIDGENEDTKNTVIEEIKAAPTRKEQEEIDNQNQLDMQQKQFEMQLDAKLDRSNATDVVKAESGSSD
jgi:hypothetical protein